MGTVRRTLLALVGALALMGASNEEPLQPLARGVVNVPLLYVAIALILLDLLLVRARSAHR